MAWTTIKTWLPHDTLSAAELNLYLRDNQLETLAGPTPVEDGIAVATGPNGAMFRPIATDYKTSQSTTTSTTPVNVGPSANLANIEHSGHILIMMSAELSNSGGSSFTNYCVGLTSGSLVTLARAGRTTTSTRASVSTHVIHWNVPSPVSLTGWLWTDNAATTALVYTSRVVVWAL